MKENLSNLAVAGENTVHSEILQYYTMAPQQSRKMSRIRTWAVLGVTKE